MRGRVLSRLTRWRQLGPGTSHHPSRGRAQPAPQLRTRRCRSRRTPFFGLGPTVTADAGANGGQLGAVGELLYPREVRGAAGRLGLHVEPSGSSTTQQADRVQEQLAGPAHPLRLWCATRGRVGEMRRAGHPGGNAVRAAAAPGPSGEATRLPRAASRRVPGRFVRIRSSG